MSFAFNPAKYMAKEKATSLDHLKKQKEKVDALYRHAVDACKGDQCIRDPETTIGFDEPAEAKPYHEAASAYNEIVTEHNSKYGDSRESYVPPFGQGGGGRSRSLLVQAIVGASVPLVVSVLLS